MLNMTIQLYTLLHQVGDWIEYFHFKLHEASFANLSLKFPSLCGQTDYSQETCQSPSLHSHLILQNVSIQVITLLTSKNSIKMNSFFAFSPSDKWKSNPNIKHKPDTQLFQSHHFECISVISLPAKVSLRGQILTLWRFDVTRETLGKRY